MTIGGFDASDSNSGLLGLPSMEEVLFLPGGFASGPERELVVAILFDAIQAFLSGENGQGDQGRARYREAFLWIENKEDNYVFSFDNVCEALGIDPDYLRFGLLNVQHTKKLNKKRRSK
jgi:hypothetical protein